MALLGERVKQRREKLGWTQTELAERSGVQQAMISRYERGEVRQARSDHLEKLANTLGVSMDYLTGAADDLSFDDLRRDSRAQAIFAGYQELSEDGREQLANFLQYIAELDRERRRRRKR